MRLVIVYSILYILQRVKKKKVKMRVMCKKQLEMHKVQNCKQFLSQCCVLDTFVQFSLNFVSFFSSRIHAKPRRSNKVMFIWGKPLHPKQDLFDLNGGIEHNLSFNRVWCRLKELNNRYPNKTRVTKIAQWPQQNTAKVCCRTSINHFLFDCEQNLLSTKKYIPLMGNYALQAVLIQSAVRSHNQAVKCKTIIALYRKLFCNKYMKYQFYLSVTLIFRALYIQKNGACLKETK